MSQLVPQDALRRLRELAADARRALVGASALDGYVVEDQQEQLGDDNGATVWFTVTSGRHQVVLSYSAGMQDDGRFVPFVEAVGGTPEDMTALERRGQLGRAVDSDGLRDAVATLEGVSSAMRYFAMEWLQRAAWAPTLSTAAARL